MMLKTKINYSIMPLKIENNNLKNNYLMLLCRIAKRKGNNTHLLIKDIILLKRSERDLNQDFFQTVLFSYDFVIIVAMLIVSKIFISNNYILSLLILFSNNILIMNQTNNIVVNLNNLFKLKYDYANLDLYKISENTIEDLYNSKIKLCKVMMYIPTILYTCLGIIFLIRFINQDIAFMTISILTMVIFAFIIYNFAPHLSLYMTPYLVSLDNVYDEYVKKGEEFLDNKLYNFPKKILVLPLTYFLLISSLLNIVSGTYWKYVYIVYCIVTLCTMKLLMNKFKNFTRKV